MNKLTAIAIAALTTISTTTGCAVDTGDDQEGQQEQAVGEDGLRPPVTIERYDSRRFFDLVDLLEVVPGQETDAEWYHHRPLPSGDHFTEGAFERKPAVIIDPPEGWSEQGTAAVIVDLPPAQRAQGHPDIVVVLPDATIAELAGHPSVVIDLDGVELTGTPAVVIDLPQDRAIDGYAAMVVELPGIAVDSHEGHSPALADLDSQELTGRPAVVVNPRATDELVDG